MILDWLQKKLWLQYFQGFSLHLLFFDIFAFYEKKRIKFNETIVNNEQNIEKKLKYFF